MSTPSGASWKSDLLLILFLGLFLGAVGALPYMYAHWTAPEDQCFTGFVGRGTVGTWGYMMMAEQYRQGEWLIENRMTPEATPKSYFNPEWWVYGRACRWSGLSLLALFHLHRVVAVYFFLFALYALIRTCVPDPCWRRAALLLICLGSGLGWIPWLVNRVLATDLHLPLDVDGVHLFGYFITKPHFIMAAACSALTLAAFVRAEETQQWRWFFLAGAVGLGHAFLRPFPLPELLLISGGLAVAARLRQGAWSTRSLVQHGIVPLMLTPAIAYYGWLSWSEVLGMRGWTPTPHFFFEEVLWLGLPLFLAFAWVAWRGARSLLTLPYPILILAFWLVSALAINQLYPYFAGGHENAFFVYAMASPVLLAALLPPWEQIRERLGLHYRFCAGVVALVIVALCLPSSALAYGRMFTRLHGAEQGRYYLHQDVCEAVDLLSHEAVSGEVVITSLDLAQVIPVYTPLRSFASHFMLTRDFDVKADLVGLFFGETASAAQRQQIIDTYAIRYAVFDGDLAKRWREVTEGLSHTTLLEKKHAVLVRFD